MIEDVVRSCEQFMETSTLGDFSIRLNMLLAYHCQLYHTNTTEKHG